MRVRKRVGLNERNADIRRLFLGLRWDGLSSGEAILRIEEEYPLGRKRIEEIVYCARRRKDGRRELMKA